MHIISNSAGAGRTRARLGLNWEASWQPQCESVSEHRNKQNIKNDRGGNNIPFEKNIKYEKKPSEAKQRYEKEHIRALKQKYIIWKNYELSVQNKV